MALARPLDGDGKRGVCCHRVTLRSVVELVGARKHLRQPKRSAPEPPAMYNCSMIAAIYYSQDQILSTIRFPV
jgi:hypothetical protein